MLSEWLELRDALARTMKEHRVLCHASKPDPLALSRARWHLSNVSRQRGAWLAGTVRPAAERLSGTPGGAAWLDAYAKMPANRQRISSFVAHWTTDALLADWDGYRRGAAELRVEIAQWLRTEEFAMRALAAELEAEQLASSDMIRRA